MKLGECAEIHSGSTPRTNNPDFWDGDSLKRSVVSSARSVLILLLTAISLPPDHLNY